MILGERLLPVIPHFKPLYNTITHTYVRKYTHKTFIRTYEHIARKYTAYIVYEAREIAQSDARKLQQIHSWIVVLRTSLFYANNVHIILLKLITDVMKSIKL